MDSRQRQDLDNYITGHYGEDSIPPDPEQVTFTFDAELTREEADRLAESLFLFLKELWHTETVVHYTVSSDEAKDEQKDVTELPQR